MAKGEFENREAEELGIPGLPGMGELSEELANERGELDSYSTVQLSDGVPADIQVGKAATDQARRAGIGSPAIDFQVRSTYDSRPVNGRDFNLWFNQNILGEAGPTLAVLRKCFAVPRGLVAVIRGLTILQAPGTELNIYDGLVALLVDNVVREPPTVRTGPDLEFNVVEQRLKIPYHSGETIETFIIADENLFVGVDIEATSLPAPSNPYPRDFSELLIIGFHGQFLQKTGVPAQFQIANKAGLAHAIDTVDPGSLVGGPQGADFLSKRRRRVTPYQQIPLVNAPK